MDVYDPSCDAIVTRPSRDLKPNEQGQIECLSWCLNWCL